jgi:hypothetical protein
MRSVKSTVSKAFHKSMATTTVLAAGLLWLKPSDTLLMIGKSAVVVDLKGLKPCWVGDRTNAEVRDGNRSLSKILTTGLMRVIGR